MDELDKIFVEHRDEFMEEPPPGHLRRFKKRLSNRDSSEMAMSGISVFWRVAAVTIIALLTANLFVHIIPHRYESGNYEVRSDISNAEIYYTNQINYGISELNNMASKGIVDEKEIELLKKEMSEMDSLFMELEKEYSSNPDDERILNAMVEHYQTKLEIINTILNDLRKVKQQKNINHANTEI